MEQAPDCFTAGLETRTCSVCKEVETTPAGFAAQLPSDFQDVDTTRWYHEGVDFVVSRYIMNGVGNGMFLPNGILTRGQLVTTLYRLAGEPETEAVTPFLDVDLDQYYGKAVVWAAEHGIAKGMTDTTFAPNMAVTREQMMTFLYRYAKFSGKDVTGSYDLTEFGDAQAVNDFASSHGSAGKTGLITRRDGLLTGKGQSTRA